MSINNQGETMRVEQLQMMLEAIPYYAEIRLGTNISQHITQEAEFVALLKSLDEYVKGDVASTVWLTATEPRPIKSIPVIQAVRPPPGKTSF
jgi:hypothetical protein